MAGEIIGSDAQFNENVDILGKLNLFDSINQVEKFVLNLDSKEKLRITPDSITFTDTLTAPNGNFTGIATASLVSASLVSATNVSVAQSVTANEYYGTFKGSIDPSVANDKITEGNTSAEVVDSGSDGHFKVLTEGTERLRIESGGNVDIKRHVHVDITPPTDANPAVGTGDWATETALVTKGDFGGGIALNDHDEMGWILHTTGFGDKLHLLSGSVGGASTERLKITGSGLFGINESNPLATLHVQDVGSTGPVLLLTGGNSSEGDITVPGGEAMQFGHWNNDNTFTERFKIHSSGHVYVEGDFTVRDQLNMHDTNNESKFFDIGFQGFSFNMRRTNSSDGAHSNFITVNSSKVVSGNFNDTSDEKLKKNIATITDGAIEDIKKLRPVTFDWIDETEPDNESGFIAQEVKQVLPNLVDGAEYDSTLLDEEKGTAGGIKSQGYSINTIGVTAHLTKALQEVIAKIEVLEAKISALESA